MKIKVEFEIPDEHFSGDTVAEIEEHIRKLPKSLITMATRITLCSVEMNEEETTDETK